VLSPSSPDETPRRPQRHAALRIGAKKRLLLSLVYTKNDPHFTKTGSGQTWKKVEKKAFCAERPLRPDVWQRPCEHGHDGRLDSRYEKEKRTFCTAIFILKNDHFTKTGSGQT